MAALSFEYHSPSRQYRAFPSKGLCRHRLPSFVQGDALRSPFVCAPVCFGACANRFVDVD
jgi:hypothetical protein